MWGSQGYYPGLSTEPVGYAAAVAPGARFGSLNRFGGPDHETHKFGLSGFSQA